jgi:peptide deformylase
MESLLLQLYPSPILKQKMPEIKDFDEDTADRVDQMFDIMYANKGIGLAANQANWQGRVIIMNLSGDPEKEDEEMVFINPEIIQVSKSTFMDEEGCLSFPEVKAEVERKEVLSFKASDLEGREMVYQADELFARCLQHEMDHLNGITFIERLTPPQRAEIGEKIKELEDNYKKAQQEE